MKKTILLFFISFAVSVILCFIVYHSFDLLAFINMSFLVSFFLLLSGLFLYVTQEGFFDSITYGFRRVFQSKGSELSKEEVDEMAPLSELVSLNLKPLFLSGAGLAAVMAVCLLIYYV
ncbi:DUF3899 domain-containing protein [Metabacillus sp. GX 13764]|uniref:DUF3899 domain-containing protein n=1 Tax=Metabacillus kandeliae TaxID=2900151 RepID=UPI001E629816|nr:DUF3899 domain-containing protein [Metabacillus kandeliae]MCD7034966.1 DUF3899 domain-containing protein [Metabacillus kandeliae]